MARVLVVGSDARAHALAWALRNAAGVEELLIAPGNAGAWMEGVCVPVDEDDVEGLVALASDRRIDLTLAASSAPLVAGLADRLRAEGLRCLGSGAARAAVVGRADGLAFLARAGVPTVPWGRFTETAAALAWLDEVGAPAVITAQAPGADACTAIADDAPAAREAIARSLTGEGTHVVVEPFVEGPVHRLHAFCDGRTFVPMPPVGVDERLHDRERGPLTPGMGAWAPSPRVGDPQPLADRVLRPLVEAAAAEGEPFFGVLSVGVVLAADGPRAYDVDVAFRDPDAAVLLSLLATDLDRVAEACLRGRLDATRVRWHPGAAAAVVLASGGYPGTFTKGRPIDGLVAVNDLDDVAVFYGGTRRTEGGILTSAGRVLAVTGRGATLRAALERAYAAADGVTFRDRHLRRDVGERALDLEPA